MEILDISKYSGEDGKNKHILNEFAPINQKHCLFIGPSGCGKTNNVLNLLITPYVYYDQIYIFAKDLNEAKYVWLKQKYEQQEQLINSFLEKKYKKPSKIKIAFFSDNLEEMPVLDELDRNKQTIFIFDDCLNEKNQELIKNIFIRGRKIGVSCYYIAQSYYKVPKLVRDNTNYVILYKVPRREIIEIGKALANTVTTKQFEDICRHVFNSGNNSFVVIDNVTTNKAYSIRKNWDGIDIYDKFVRD